MFTKLLKHEFRSVSKPLLLMSAGCIIAGILGGLLAMTFVKNINNDNPFAVILPILLLVGIFFLLVAYSVGSYILLYVRFYKHKFSDQGYLTFTLPASTHQILLSSVLNNLIWTIIISLTLIVSYLAIVIPPAYLTMDEMVTSTFMDIYYIMQHDMQTIYGNEIVFSYILTLICSLAYSIILPMLSITTGAIVAKKHKILAAVGIGYGISMIISTLSGIMSVVEVIMFETMNAEISLSLTLIVPAVLMLVIAVVGYFLMHYFIDKKLNL